MTGVTVGVTVVHAEQNCLQGFYYANGFCEAQAGGTGGGNLHGVMRM